MYTVENVLAIMNTEYEAFLAQTLFYYLVCFTNQYANIIFHNWTAYARPVSPSSHEKYFMAYTFGYSLLAFILWFTLPELLSANLFNAYLFKLLATIISDTLETIFMTTNDLEDENQTPSTAYSLLQDITTILAMCLVFSELLYLVANPATVAFMVSAGNHILTTNIRSLFRKSEKQSTQPMFHSFEWKHYRSCLAGALTLFCSKDTVKPTVCAAILGETLYRELNPPLFFTNHYNEELSIHNNYKIF